MKKFSIVVPIYNIKSKFFEECINSIKNQSYKNFEVIIVDDGSDETYKCDYEKIIKDDNRFSIITQENKGVSIARNNGVKKCTGDYLIFVDADDYIENNLLEKMINVISRYKECDVILFESYGESYDEEEYVKTLDKNERESLIKKLIDENNWLGDEYSIKHFGSVWNKCYRLEYLKCNNIELIPGIKYSEDVLYSIKVLFSSENIIYTNYPLYHYRIYGASTFDKYNKKADIDLLNFLIKLKELLVELGLYNKMYEAYLMKVYTSYQFAMTLKFFNKENNEKNNKNVWVQFNNNKFIREMILKINKSKLNLKGKFVVFFAKNNLYLPIKIIYKIKSNIR